MTLLGCLVHRWDVFFRLERLGFVLGGRAMNGLPFQELGEGQGLLEVRGGWGREC